MKNSKLTTAVFDNDFLFFHFNHFPHTKDCPKSISYTTTIINKIYKNTFKTHSPFPIPYKQLCETVRTYHVLDPSFDEESNGQFRHKYCAVV